MERETGVESGRTLGVCLAGWLNSVLHVWEAGGLGRLGPMIACAVRRHHDGHCWGSRLHVLLDTGGGVAALIKPDLTPKMVPTLTAKA